MTGVDPATTDTADEQKCQDVPVSPRQDQRIDHSSESFEVAGPPRLSQSGPVSAGGYVQVNKDRRACTLQSKRETSEEARKLSKVTANRPTSTLYARARGSEIVADSRYENL